MPQTQSPQPSPAPVVVPTVEQQPSRPAPVADPLPATPVAPAAPVLDLPPGPAAPGNHWEKANGGWMQVFTDPRIYNPDGTYKQNTHLTDVPGESFPEPTWAKPLKKDGYWDNVVNIWNQLVQLGPKEAWDRAMKLDVGGQVSTAAIQQYPEDRQAIQLSYSYAEDHNRGHK